MSLSDKANTGDNQLLKAMYDEAAVIGELSAEDDDSSGNGDSDDFWEE